MKAPNQPNRKANQERRQPPRRNAGKSAENSPRPSLVEEISGIDKAILKLFLRRHNLLEKLRRNGQIQAADEKTLREAWQKEATQISRDPDLTSKIFPILQSLSFLPKPDRNPDEIGERISGQESFTLHPPRLSVKIKLTAPLSSRLSRIWLYMACALGKPLSLQNLLMGTRLTDFIRLMERLGAKFNSDIDNIAALPGMPIASPDIAIHTGDDPFNFLIILSHYILRPTRAKIMADISMEPAMFTSLTAFLASLGCRLTPTIPKNLGFPCRIECSGLLPAVITFPDDLPEDLALALAIACLFYDKPLTLDLERLPDRANLLSGLIPLLDQAGAAYKLGNFTIEFEPSPLSPPTRPRVPFDPCVASFLLSLPMPLTGECRLAGMWPEWRKIRGLRDLLIRSGLPWRGDDDLATCGNSESSWNFQLPSDVAILPSELPDWAQPLICALAACACLGGGSGIIPSTYLEDQDTLNFIAAAGLASDPQGKLEIATRAVPIWNAPDPVWAMALALAACAGKGRPPLRLGNPGIVTGLWGYFWRIYNFLPVPGAPAAKAPATPAQPKRRRIHTSAIAKLPEIKEEE